MSTRKPPTLMLIGINEAAIATYLAGRPRDPRVKYRTWHNTGKRYPYSSVRQNTRLERRIGRALARVTA